MQNPAKPRSKDGKSAARVIDVVDIPMLDGNYYEVKLVSGSGARRKPLRNPETVYVNRNGAKVMVNKADWEANQEPLWNAAASAPAAPVEDKPHFKPETYKPAPPPPPPAFDLAEANVDQAQVYIMELESMERLAELEEAERAGKGRKMVLRAIQDRREELEP